MNRGKILIVLTMFSFVGCATYQEGNESITKNNPGKKNLILSAKVDRKLSSSNYRLVNVYLGNKTNDWMRLKQVKVIGINNGEEKTTEVVSGRDLANWAESAQYMNEVDNWNRDILLGSLALAGAVVGSSSGGDPSAAGMGLFAASTSIIIANEIIDGLSELERAKLYPNSHIYRTSSIPAQMYSKKWLLLKGEPSKRLEKLELELTFEDGEKIVHIVKFS